MNAANPIIPSAPPPMRNAVTKTSDDIAKLIAEARQQCAYPNIHFHYSDGPRVMGGLADALEALATPSPEPQPEVVAEPIGYARSVDVNPQTRPFTAQTSFWCSERQSAYYSVPVYLATPSVVEEAVKAEREACAEVVRKLIPSMPEDGPINAAHEAEYSALGFAMLAILARGTAP